MEGQAVDSNVQGTVSPRIEWVDLFKAICILSMVIGHAWGGMNDIIYQFHMAAFFFISGFTSGIWKKDTESLFISKTWTLIIPILVMVALLSPLVHILDGVTPVDSIGLLVKDYRDYLIWGATVNLLGTVWFLTALFSVFIIQRLIYKVTEEHGGLFAYFAVTVALFIVGYYLSDYNYRTPHFLDVALIAQLYFGAGVMLRQGGWQPKVLSIRVSIIIAAICGLIMYLLTLAEFQVTMDMVSRTYPSLLVMCTVPFIGFVTVYAVSCILTAVPGFLKTVMLTLGRETLGIMFLHFACFKIATLLFVVLGIAEFSDLESFLLPSFASGNLWITVAYIAISVFCSVVIWKSLRDIPVVGKLLGRT